MSKTFKYLTLLLISVLFISCASTKAVSVSAPVINELYYTTNNPEWISEEDQEAWPRIDEVMMYPSAEDVTDKYRYAIVAEMTDVEGDFCALFVSFDDFETSTRYLFADDPGVQHGWFWWNDIYIFGTADGTSELSAYAIDEQGNKSDIYRFPLAGIVVSDETNSEE